MNFETAKDTGPFGRKSKLILRWKAQNEPGFQLTKPSTGQEHSDSNNSKKQQKTRKLRIPAIDTST
jgi:hypothetical protein